MSEPHDQDAPRDPVVSAAYRAMSMETTSEQLDRNILKKATAATSKRPSRLLSLKPWAWAATMALTVTLVLELQQNDTPQILIDENAAMPIDRNAGSSAAVLDEAVENAVADQDLAAEPAEKAAKKEQSRSIAPSAIAPATLRRAERIGEEQEAKDSRLDLYAPAIASESRARMKRDDRRFCDATATADASSWYRCVLELEDAGRFDEAELERTRLFSNYPDFEVR